MGQQVTVRAHISLMAGFRPVSTIIQPFKVYILELDIMYLEHIMCSLRIVIISLCN